MERAKFWIYHGPMSFQCIITLDIPLSFGFVSINVGYFVVKSKMMVKKQRRDQQTADKF